jgi:hypothetical protein
LNGHAGQENEEEPSHQHESVGAVLASALFGGKLYEIIKQNLRERNSYKGLRLKPKIQDETL